MYYNWKKMDVLNETQNFFIDEDELERIKAESNHFEKNNNKKYNSMENCEDNQKKKHKYFDSIIIFICNNKILFTSCVLFIYIYYTNFGEKWQT